MVLGMRRLSDGGREIARGSRPRVHSLRLTPTARNLRRVRFPPRRLGGRPDFPFAKGVSPEMARRRLGEAPSRRTHSRPPSGIPKKPLRKNNAQAVCFRLPRRWDSEVHTCAGGAEKLWRWRAPLPTISRKPFDADAFDTNSIPRLPKSSVFGPEYRTKHPFERPPPPRPPRAEAKSAPGVRISALSAESEPPRAKAAAQSSRRGRIQDGEWSE